MLKEHDVINGKYIVTGFIAEGGTSLLYELKDQQGKKAVLKIVKEPTTLFKQQLENESKILASLEIANIPVLYDKFQYKDQYPAIVMEKVPGKTIAYLIEKDKQKFHWKQLLSVAKQMALMVKQLHDHQPAIIMRDIKPSNVLLTDDNRVSIVDFGAAATPETNTMALGTIGFAAPEQFERGVCDGRSDLFSMGATLFYILSNGKNIFTTEHEAMVWERLPKSFAKIILKLTKTDKSERYQNIDQLIKELDKVKLSWKERFFSRRFK
ncbi:serine/threonine protein kinase [Virgibacillus halophilus]|uniref:Serine/threonine-protein kinase n=1 Tax=Tigheibacillus halophilus TaxID=361280 RepID=A0ABU5C8G9_9BACI|nr:serine/threonine-protein kinase [Virgibacillus halophilus]